MSGRYADGLQHSAGEIDTRAAAAPVAGQALVATGPNTAAFSAPSPGGSAGGDLTGTYPNPTVGANKIAVAQMHASATDVLFGRSTAAAGAGEEIACTAAGRALIDDANASAQRTTLGLGTVALKAGYTFAVRTVYTTGAANHTWAAGTTAADVICVGGGGGGGGTSRGSSLSGLGAGGGSGGFVQKFFTGLTGGGTAAYSVGALGAGGTAGGANTGSTGGATTFSTLTANGGIGGPGMASGSSVLFRPGGAGGAVSTGGDINGAGTPGQPSMRTSGTAGGSGAGASSPYGGGGAGGFADAVGVAASGYGSGGGGGTALGATDRAGGNGSAGIIIVEEYQ